MLVGQVDHPHDKKYLCMYPCNYYIYITIRSTYVCTPVLSEIRLSGNLEYLCKFGDSAILWYYRADLMMEPGVGTDALMENTKTVEFGLVCLVAMSTFYFS